MDPSWRVYKAFISSPGDVKKERKVTKDMIHKIDNSLGDILKISFKPITWESMAPITPYIHEEQIQDVLNKQVNECHFFILILNKRYGSVEKGHTISNTEREINTILNRFRNDRKIKIISFFKKNPTNKDPGDQEKRVIELKKRLSSLNIWYQQYRTTEEFSTLLSHALYEAIIKMKFSTFKHKCLVNFWKIGSTEKPTQPRLAIIYPPVDRKYMDATNDKDFWVIRLAPHIIFEDYITIHKIKKLLAMIDFPDYKVFQTNNLPSDISHMNRIWICIPRNNPAIKQMNLYNTKLKFGFDKRLGGRYTKLIWKNSAGEVIKIESPLYSYLKEQRVKMDISDEWKPQFSQIIAKDYAILARLKDNTQSEYNESGPLWDYFIAGIRGLGTWGAIWFIDIKYKHLYTNYQNNDNIQLLLEVTYKNGKIFDVNEVSDKPAEYFEQENDIEVIRKNILKHID